MHDSIQSNLTGIYNLIMIINKIERKDYSFHHEN